MREFKALYRALAVYCRSDDPLAAAGNVIALCVVGNQPFYPLYVWWIVGDDGGASLVTFLSTPFFLAVPAVARRSSLAGRAMLPIVGIANTVLSAKAFGVASGVELFLCPCAMIAGMALRAQERRIMLVTVGLAIAAFALGGVEMKELLSVVGVNSVIVDVHRRAQAGVHRPAMIAFEIVLTIGFPIDR